MLQINNQQPGSNPTISLASPASHQTAMEQARSCPDLKLLICALNRVGPGTKVKSEHAEVMKKMEVTGMRDFRAVTKFVVKAEGFHHKLRNELKANDCPELLIDAMVEDIELVDEDQKIKLDNKVIEGKGTLFKLMYFMKRKADRVEVSMAVFGASFDQKTVTHYEEVKTPVLEERESEETVGWLWWKKTQKKPIMVAVDEKVVKTPCFKTMTGEDVMNCMEHLEDKCCEKVLETAAPREKQAAQDDLRLATRSASQSVIMFWSIAAAIVIGVAPSLLPYAWKSKKQEPMWLTCINAACRPFFSQARSF